MGANGRCQFMIPFRESVVNPSYKMSEGIEQSLAT